MQVWAGTIDYEQLRPLVLPTLAMVIGFGVDDGAQGVLIGSSLGLVKTQRAQYFGWAGTRAGNCTATSTSVPVRRNLFFAAEHFASGVIGMVNIKCHTTHLHTLVTQMS